MSVDIYLDGNDVLQKANTDIYKAKNILLIQVGNAYYAQNLGIDLKRFLDPKIKIQFETFRSYTLQTLIQQGIKIESIIETQQNLDKILDYNVAKTETEGMIL